MIRTVLGVLCIFVSLASCKLENSQSQNADFGEFTMKLPIAWVVKDQRCTDSSCGIIVIDENDTLYFDKGVHSNTLTEEEPKLSLYEQIPYLLRHGFDTSAYIFVNDLRNTDIDVYRKQNVSFIDSKGITIKLTYPRRSGEGKTGFYIDSLGNTNLGKLSFSMHGKDLNPRNEKIVLNLMSSIEPKL